ncbi:hypothetical protein BCR36DRAFT_331859 [Piromyces finnis]|uniref:Uncharacterized protein n=1 Tax=Piromyces finnis TaxID=1754191 RepID=A0A1Y1V3M7_9FUNG|nr:hypothetical protein BCR36DRAFT_331859 [Piromyces finnis]|eukprot:ORX46425.1 hypothetical protein BCR36DRAFT_331859 [Piromyces finnis]
MKQTTHSVNSSKNLLLSNNNLNRENSDLSNSTYSQSTTPENKINNQLLEDLPNQSFNFNTLNNNTFNTNTPNISFNNSTTNNNILVNSNNFNNSLMMSNSSNNNNSFSLNNNSTRNLLGNNTLNTINNSMNQLRQNSFNNSFTNNAQIQNSPTNIINSNLPSPSTQQNVNNSMNNNINNSINNSFNNLNTSSHNIKILNTINSMDIPASSPMKNKGASSPPVPPLALGKDDSDYEEEKDNQMVIVIDPSTLLLPVNEVVNTITDPAIIPNSVEDWIKYHAAIDPERKFLSPDEPPSKIPILESMIPLDEVITPQRSVSCRIRLLQQQRRKKAQELAEQEKLLQQATSKSLNNAMNNDAIVYSSPSIKMPSAVRSSKKINNESTNLRSGTNNRYTLPKNPPKFQLCTYNKCEWIATNKCEKCSNLCCLDHSQRFYYFLPSLFSPKYYCPDCMKSVTKFWKWCYLIIGILMLILLGVGAGAHYSKMIENRNNFVFSIFSIILVLLIIMAFSFSYLSNQYTEKTKETERLLLD